MKRTGPTNPNTIATIRVLKKNKTPLWQRIAKELEVPTRSRSHLNVDQLETLTKANETVVIPGKVLGMGVLSKKLNVCALAFSESARKKIIAAGGKVMTIDELEAQNPKGSGIRILKGAQLR